MHPTGGMRFEEWYLILQPSQHSLHDAETATQACHIPVAATGSDNETNENLGPTTNGSTNAASTSDDRSGPIETVSTCPQADGANVPALQRHDRHRRGVVRRAGRQRSDLPLRAGRSDADAAV